MMLVDKTNSASTVDDENAGSGIDQWYNDVQHVRDDAAAEIDQLLHPRVD